MKKRISKASYYKQLKRGTFVEYEHANTIRKAHKGPTPKWKVKQIAKMIAKDHLSEHSDYYYRHARAKL